MPHGDYRDLVAWQKAMDLVESVCRTSHEWPKDEMYGLTNQVRRASVSVPANIAEGQGRKGTKEFAHHLSIAHGSLREVETHLLIASRLRYCPQNVVATVMEQTAEVGRLLHGLMRSLER